MVQKLEDGEMLTTEEVETLDSALKADHTGRGDRRNRSAGRSNLRREKAPDTR